MWSRQDGPVIAEDQYEYRALKTTTAIRLIKVSRKSIKGCIACRIYHFNDTQQESIKYYALSYVWGDPTPTRQVYLQDHGGDWYPFLLHENLWQFLDHVRRCKLFDRLFWTDRLCLDQRSHEEISQQVPRMRAIYRNAELAVVWLQLEEKEQHGLRELVRWSHRLKLMPQMWHRDIRERLSSFQDAILSGMESPYWGRVWIVQEVVLARKVSVWFGDVSIDLEDLRALVHPFRKEGLPSGKPSMWLLCDMRTEGGKIPLWRILREFTDYQSSRPVDRVYGLLGMVADHDDGSSPLEHIEVDYDKPILHVLLDAMFESSTPLTEYAVIPLCLGPPETYDTVSLLRDYIVSVKTMRRHREFADFALQAFEAFAIVKSVKEIHEDSMKQLIDDFLFAAKADWNPRLGQSAALIGLVLAKGSWARPLDHWRAQRKRRGEASSPWRCDLHQVYYEFRTGLESYKTVFTVTLQSHWGSKGVVGTCAEQDLNCHRSGSTLTFDIPQIGLRLLLESAINQEDVSILSVQENRFWPTSPDSA